MQRPVHVRARHGAAVMRFTLFLSLQLLQLLLFLMSPSGTVATTAKIYVSGLDVVLQAGNASGRVVANATDLAIGNTTMSGLQGTLSQQLVTQAEQASQLQQVLFAASHPNSGDMTITGSTSYTTLPFSAVYGIFNVTLCSFSTLPSMPYLAAVYGDLNIDSNSALTSISSFAQLATVSGSLTVVSNPSLSSLDGLQNVQRINGSALIESNALKNLTGLDSLQSINGPLSVTPPSTCSVPVTSGMTICESQLVELNGLNNVTSIDGNILVQQNTALTSLTGLNGVVTVSGAVAMENNALTSITGLNALAKFADTATITSVSNCPSGLDPGDLTICENNLQSISGFRSVLSIFGTFQISNNPSLTSIEGFSALQSVAGAIEINCNPLLTDLSGFSNLTTVSGNVWINYPPACGPMGESMTLPITSVSMFGNLRSANGFYVYQTNITSLEGFPKALSTIGGGSLFIENNYLLRNVDGLEGLRTINGQLTIEGNGITSLSALSGLQSVIGTISITEPVDDLSFLGNLTQLNSLTLTSTALSNFTSFPTKPSIPNSFSLTILNNLNLTSLDGLGHVTTFSSLSITGNSNLVDIGALRNVTYISAGLTIENNAKLTVCESLQAKLNATVTCSGCVNWGTTVVNATC